MHDREMGFKKFRSSAGMDYSPRIAFNSIVISPQRFEGVRAFYVDVVHMGQVFEHTPPW